MFFYEYRVPRFACYYRNCFYNREFMTGFVLSFHYPTSCWVRIFNNILTFCRYSMDSFIIKRVPLRELNYVLSTTDDTFIFIEGGNDDDDDEYNLNEQPPRKKTLGEKAAESVFGKRFEPPYLKAILDKESNKQAENDPTKDDLNKNSLIEEDSVENKKNSSSEEKKFDSKLMPPPAKLTESEINERDKLKKTMNDLDKQILEIKSDFKEDKDHLKELKKGLEFFEEKHKNLTDKIKNNIPLQDSEKEELKETESYIDMLKPEKEDYEKKVKTDTNLFNLYSWARSDAYKTLNKLWRGTEGDDKNNPSGINKDNLENNSKDNVNDSGGSDNDGGGGE